MKKIMFFLSICLCLLGCDTYKARILFEQAQTLEQKNEFEAASKKYELLIKDFPKTEFVEQARAQFSDCQEIINKKASLKEESEKAIKDKNWFVAIKKLEEIQQLGVTITENTQTNEKLNFLREKRAEELEIQKKTLIAETEELIKNNDLSSAIKKLEEADGLELETSEKEKISEQLNALRIKRADELYEGKNKAGKKVKRSYKQAFALYQKAADAGEAYAQYSTGWMLMFGQGTTKNREEALRYYELAAAQGHEDAIKQSLKLKELKQLDTTTKDRNNIWLTSWLRATQGDVYRKYGNNPNHIGDNSDGNPCFIYGAAPSFGIISHTITFCFKKIDHSKEKKVYLVREYFPHIRGRNDYPKLFSKIPSSFKKVPKKYTKVTQEYPYQVKTYSIGDEIWKVRFYEDTEAQYDVNSGEYNKKIEYYITMLEVELDS